MAGSGKKQAPQARPGQTPPGRHQTLILALCTLFGGLVGAGATVAAAYIIDNESTPVLTPPGDGCVSAEDAVGMALVRVGENCAFSRTFQPVEARCPAGWVCEWERAKVTEVVLGGPEVDTATVYSGTWRYVDAYAEDDDVRNICAFAEKVKKTSARPVEVVGATCDP